MSDPAVLAAEVLHSTECSPSSFDKYVFIVRVPSLMSNGNFMCALRVSFIVRFFTSLNLPPKQINSPPLRTTDSIAHVFLAEGVGRASIASDQGSAPKKGMEHFLQPMGSQNGSTYAKIETTTEPLRGAGHRDAPTCPHPMRRRVTSGRTPPTSREE